MRRSNRDRARRISIGLAVVASTAACGAPASVRNPFTERPVAVDSGDGVYLPNEISRSEIVSRGKSDHTAMALIRRLRPSWLRARGQKSFVDPAAGYPIVYIDEIRHGGLPTLHQIPAAEIHALQYFSMADATTRWGTGHPSGVINVVTGRF
ncbi:MAG TPA: hypothetical protein VLA09_11795 [Longimicrobiales bacterium]|nr:hypothetical protein [Longimicrobiales bacterium]